MKSLKSIGLIILILSFTSMLTSCALSDQSLGNLESALKGRIGIIQTYDEESNIIDHIEGDSVDIRPDSAFEVTDDEGTTVQKSGVLSIIIGGKMMVHVGSSLILSEKGLPNVYEEYAKTVNISNTDRSKPFVNRMVNSVKNLTTGHSLLILVRSQSGKPLAAYVGSNVSYFSTEIDKSTAFLVDGNYLFIYRCDYTVYDLTLLQ